MTETDHPADIGDRPTPPPAVAVNADPGELANFAAMAAHWWDPEGPLKPLHVMNPVRLDYTVRASGRLGVPVCGSRWLDVGTGGGILAESAARLGAKVTGIDANPALIDTARLHAAASGVDVIYEVTQVAEFAAQHPDRFDIVTCLELLEHVPDPGALLGDCLRLLRPGGCLVVSTINRNPAAYLGTVVAAEYLLRLLPRGTHDYQRFIRPSELARFAREAGGRLAHIEGIRYLPGLDIAQACRSTRMNYIATLVRIDA